MRIDSIKTNSTNYKKINNDANKINFINNQFIENKNYAQVPLHFGMSLDSMKCIRCLRDELHPRVEIKLNEYYDPSKEIGLNRVVGFFPLKKGLSQNVLLPMLEVMDGNLTAHSRIPNGICFLGPPGVGKTFITRALMEHYQAKGGYIKDLNFTGDDAKDIVNMAQSFAEAEQKFHESGNKKYTLVFLDSLENTAKKFDTQNANIRRTSVLLNLVENCKDRGFIFISNSLRPSLNPPELLRNGRTDLRIPVGFVENYDIADFVNYYVKQAGVNYDNLDYTTIVENFKKTNKSYIPMEINNIVRSAIRTTKDSLNTNKIRRAIENADLGSSYVAIKFFEDEKEFARKLGGLNENARYLDE